MRALVSAGLALALLATSPNPDRGRDCLGHEGTIIGPNTHLHAREFRGVIVGTSHRDVIVGSRRPEWIVGAGGRDAICGEGGGDYIVSGDWSRQGDRPTRLDGGLGVDYIDGSFARDRIIGGPGGDAIDGEFGDDRIAGSGGDDFVRTQAGADHLRLGAGDDHVEASSGDDVVRGGAGADNISTGAGNDVVFGEGGNDSIHLIWRHDRGFGGSGDDAVHGGPGRDRCSGGPGADSATACERRRSLGGEPPLPGTGADPEPRRPTGDHRRRRNGPPAFERTAPMLEIQRFLRRLHRKKAIGSPSATERQIRRKHVLGHRVASLVEQRYKNRLRQTDRVEAMFEKSVERHRLKLTLAAICDEIDRLRWTV